jgi:hypothetical protein
VLKIGKQFSGSQAEQKFVVFFIYISYLLLLFPTVIWDGIVRRQILVGDPFYTSRMKPTSLNKLDFANVYLPEGSIFNGKTEALSLGEIFLSKIGFYLNIGISDLYIYSSLLIGVAILFFIQKIFREFKISGIKTLLFSIVFVFIFWGPFLPYSLERPISPQLVLFLWLLFILYFIRAIDTDVLKNHVIYGFISGISLYFHYPFIFLQIQVGLVFFIIYKIINKQNVKKNIIAILISWVIAIPYLLWSMNANRFDTYQDLLLRQALITSHIPAAAITAAISFTSLGMVFLVFKYSNSKFESKMSFKVAFIGIQALSSAAVANSNLISGKAIEFSNHFEVFAKAIFILSCGLFFKYFKLFTYFEIRSKGNFRQKKSVSIFLVLLLMTFSFSYAANRGGSQGLDIGNTNLIDWSKDNLSKTDSLLIENPTTSSVSSVMLPNKLFMDGNIVWFNFSQKEINKRYYANSGCSLSDFTEVDYEAIYAFRGVAESRKIVRVLKVLEEFNLFPLLRNSLNKELEKETRNKSSLEDNAIDDFEDVKSVGCINFIKSRGVDFIYSDLENNWSSFEKQGLIKKIKVIGDTSVYKIN